MGTSTGTKVFVEAGWRASASLSMGWMGWQIVIILLRGPHVPRYTWFGYAGGLEARKSVVNARERAQKGEQERKQNEENETARPSVAGSDEKARPVEVAKDAPASDDRAAASPEPSAGRRVKDDPEKMA
jgi:hypothetical protein